MSGESSFVRDHVLSGRAFSSIEELDAAFTTWTPQRLAQAHRPHQPVIGERAARDDAALKPRPPTPYLVAERHLRPVGKDCLVAFGSNLYSVPARKIRPRQLVNIRSTKSQVMLHSTVSDGETLQAMHPQAAGRGAHVVDETHWDGLPTGKSRRTTTVDPQPSPGTNRHQAVGDSIAVALAVAACRAGCSIYFTSSDYLVRSLTAAEAAGRLTSKLGTYLRPSVLVVDEVGYQPLERAEANLVFQVISKRYEKGSIISPRTSPR